MRYYDALADNEPLDICRECKRCYTEPRYEADPVAAEAVMTDAEASGESLTCDHCGRDLDRRDIW